jgi:putative thioredoxin
MDARMSEFDVQDFKTEVLDTSYDIPVLVDFWAEWCGPCKVLGPTLEKVAASAMGRWQLKKVNTEKLPELSAQFGIRSIPNVKLFFQGKQIDEFIGALPEQAITSWLEKALPDPNNDVLDHAEVLLRDGRTDDAEREARSVLRSLPGHERARTLTAAAILFTDSTAALELVQDLEEGSTYWERGESVRKIAWILVRSAKPDSFDEKPVKELYLKGIVDLQAQRFGDALQAFIDVIREDRYYDDDGARKICIAIFKYLGEDHPITRDYRRDFGSALYV